MEAVARALESWLHEHDDPLWGLDFDGTLVGLDPDPARVHLSPEGVAILTGLARRHECAVISGRSLADLERQVPIEGLSLVGNHGGELRPRQGTEWNWLCTPAAAPWLAWRRSGVAEVERLAGEREAWVEDKNLSLTVHFRGSPAERWWISHGGEILQSLLDPSARLMAGKLAWNIVPENAPDKGSATRRLMTQTRRRALVYFGDEVTDENVFRLQGLEIFGVKVGEGPTAAPYRLSAPSEVLALLARFV